MEDKIPLRLIGITYNQVESGVYALILEEEGGRRRLPIIIGYPEAQAIECKLQDVQTPRPLTHDLFVNTLMSFGIDLLEVYIRRMSNGIFTADLVCRSPRGREVRIDARSSDAIALAIRTGSVIYTSEEVLRQAAFIKEGNSAGKLSEEDQESRNRLEGMTVEALRKAMEKAVENEDYERAGEIKKELDRRSAMQ